MGKEKKTNKDENLFDFMRKPSKKPIVRRAVPRTSKQSKFMASLKRKTERAKHKITNKNSKQKWPGYKTIGYPQKSRLPETTIDRYNAILDLYTKAKLHIVSQGTKSYNPLSTLINFLQPFEPFISEAKSPFANLIKEYTGNLLLIAKAHLDILKTFPNPAPRLLQELQYYINDHLFYALITFRNDAANTNKLSGSALDKRFEALKNKFIAHKQSRTSLTGGEFILFRANPKSKLAKGNDIVGKKLKLCARPRSNPKEDTSIKNKKDELPHYIHPITGPASAENFQQSETYFIDKGFTNSNKRTRAVVTRKLPDWLFIIDKHYATIKHLKNQPAQQNNNNSPTSSSLNLFPKKNNTLQTISIKPSASATPAQSKPKYETLNGEYPQEALITLEETAEQKSLLVEVFNRIMSTQNNEKHSKYLRVLPHVKAKNYKPLKLAHVNPLSGLAQFVAPFRDLIKNLATQNTKFKKSELTAIQSGLFHYLDQIAKLQHLLLTELKGYKDYRSKEINLDMICYYNAKGMHALCEFWAHLLKKNLAKKKVISSSIQSIKNKLCVFTEGHSLNVLEDTEYNSGQPIMIRGHGASTINTIMQHLQDTVHHYSYITPTSSNDNSLYFEDIPNFLEAKNILLGSSSCGHSIAQERRSMMSRHARKLIEVTHTSFEEIVLSQEKQNQITRTLN